MARQTAAPCTIHELKTAPLVENEGPSALQTERGMFSRVSVLALVVERPSETTAVIDDGSGKITARSFDVAMQGDIGDPVNIIGRPREFDSKRYVAVEICKKLANNGWLLFRRKELSLAKPVEFETPAVQTEEIVIDNVKTPFETILEVIRSLDRGNGADMDEVIKKSSTDETEKLLKTLLEEGEIFEMKPGRVKVLE